MGAAKQNNPTVRSHFIPAAKRALYHRLLLKHLRIAVPIVKQIPAGLPNNGRWKLRNLYYRLMHKGFLAQRLNAHHRGFCLILNKRFGIPRQQGTIPSYFRKCIIRQRRLEKYAKADQEEVKLPQIDHYISSDDCVLVDEEDQPRRKIKKQVEIPDPTKFSILKQEIKEYCEVQEKIQFMLSMLRSRIKELEYDDAADEQAAVEEPVVSTIKCEEPELDTAELESIAEKYYDNSDNEDTKEGVVGKGVFNDDSIDVEEAESKPEILFVDANVFQDDSCDEKKMAQTDSKENLIPLKSLKDISKTDLLDPTFSTIKLEPVEKKNSVVDSLFSKFNLKLPDSPAKASVNPPTDEDESMIGRLRDRSKIAYKPRYVDDDEPKKIRPSKIFDKIHKSLNLELDNTNSNSSTEFYGFDEGEVVKLDKPSVPGLLPTPIVKKSRPDAPFLAHGTSFEDIKIENRDDLFREEGLISFGSLPPRLKCPRRPDDMVRPRTVAQKRILLQKKNDVRYLMIDNESKIFHELEKRSKNIDAELDFERMLELQNQNIPFTRDTWRALAWLRTEKGKYFFQTLRVDNHSIKLSGCKGNHISKRYGKKQFSVPSTISRKLLCRCPEIPENFLQDLSPIMQPLSEVKLEQEDIEAVGFEPDKKLLCSNTTSRVTSNIRPGPLSSKLKYNQEPRKITEEDAYLGPLEILEMPRVEIEVFPRIDRPLDPAVKPYLKMILPFREITEKWARFAVSTLKTPDRDEAEGSFSFSLPYSNNQRRLLIRRRLQDQTSKRSRLLSSAGNRQKFESELEQPLTFRKHLDASDDNSKEVDPVEKECADILSEMTNAVAIGLADELFIGCDPDCDYGKEDKPLNKATNGNVSAGLDGGKTSECAAKSKRMLREMKRLNATIIETIPEQSGAAGSDPKSRCDLKYCSKGCICDVLTGGRHKTILGSNAISGNVHCNKIDCIFECECGFETKKRIAEPAGMQDMSADLSSLSNEDVKYLRDRATARLAKEEREFTPTVIMTTNSTVLVRNAEMEARRHKKKPKKYDDYYNGDSVRSILNGIIPSESEANQRDTSVERSGKSAPPAVVDRPLTILDKIRHSHVVLNRLQDLNEIEPWCMIHCLYRCYCNGNATSGKPFKFNEESAIVLPAPVNIPPDPLLQVYEPRRRRLYSFEKPEEEVVVHQSPRKRDSSEESYKPWNERRKKKRRTGEYSQQRTSSEGGEYSESANLSRKASHEDINSDEGSTCRRVVSVNRNYYKTRNYYRKERYQRDIEELKRKNPSAEKRLKYLLERCERSFLLERRKEMDASQKVATKTRKLSEGDKTGPTIEPIHIDLVGDDDKFANHTLFSPLLDTNKLLISCGKKKYYVECDAIRNGKINLNSIARKFRTTVYVIRKVAKASQAKSITFTYKNETIILHGRAYSRNQPYELPANEHVDLNSDSDELSSSASLVQDTSGENDAQKLMLDQVNSDIMHTMQHIRDMLRKNTAKLNPPKKGILYLFRWEKFLQAFNEEMVDVWDITFQSGSELVVITSDSGKKNPPSFKNSKSIRQARRCNFETKGVSLLTQMVLYQIDNPETNKLSLVLFGTENYWRFCGFVKAGTNSLEHGIEVRPTPVSHPKLAPKINRYFEAYVANKKNRAASSAATPAVPVAMPAPKTHTVKVPVPIKTENDNLAQNIEKPIRKSLSGAIAQKLPSIKTNVKLMETKIKDFKNIAIPNVGTRRWFMLNVINDFSDIYIPSWKSCLTYGRIQQAIHLANRYGKTVKLTSIVMKSNQEDVLPQIYAAPGQGNCIFLGPYKYTQNIDLMLCQNVDGKMFTREEYEKNNHIVRTEQTTGSWLYMKPNVSPNLQATIPPPTKTETVPSADSDDCVVIDDDEDGVEENKIEKPMQTASIASNQSVMDIPDTCKNNSQLESLIHQLYDDSDSDDGEKPETSISQQPVPETITPDVDDPSKNQLSKIVEKTIAESKQLQAKAISVDKASTKRLSGTGSSADSSAPADHQKHVMTQSAPNIKAPPPLKRKSTSEIELKATAVEKTKKARTSLPAPSASNALADDIVCLDDDEDNNEDERRKLSTAPSPSKKNPSSTTILNSQQAALIASKINLLNPSQKGVVYNPSTGVLRIRRSLMNSITEGSTLDMPTATAGSSKAQTPTNPNVKDNASSGSLVPSSIITPPTTPQAPQTQGLAMLKKTRIMAPITPTDGVLRSNIPGLGLVPVTWCSKDIVVKVRELSVRHQFVRLSNYEAAILLLNRFIRKNTYTFKPFSLNIDWKFEARSEPLPPEENLISTISLRCIVSTDGIIDLYKANEILAFQNSKPNFYEELLLLRLSILCCKKEQYEKEMCHKYFENIFVKATNSIKELKSASEALTTQSDFLREQQGMRRSYLRKLKANTNVSTLPVSSKRVSVPQATLERISNAIPVAQTSETDQACEKSKQKEAVIVIDDD
ncbi:uncharacterized protein LOC128734710 [Sabethes cyaneus]|uniref:uncharacterized protein LOC128734710 n=1 Tax=Sabethes cyaneus TaxID=53552 RepID=UPI00237D4412|nr:uncharacterized protein LOC128734710 [Sabethes cyaneus]XP_053684998.1 uncharacterized protein LOC128734710 [Sabethes cyaneus]XP_053684999.1 uncharacterized protein LOC128734710 [Sabethes cyaneus]